MLIYRVMSALSDALSHLNAQLLIVNASSIPVQSPARAGLTVTAGMVPGSAVAAHTRVWWYSEADYDQDSLGPPGDGTILVALREQAVEYTRQLITPDGGGVNWCRMDYARA